jgi:protein-glutamine gamma-glutamyltransferase
VSPPGSRQGLLWAAAAFAAAALLNLATLPPWVLLSAAVLAGWRLQAERLQLRLPNTITRTLLAILLVGSILLRYHTLNGLSAGTALLVVMGAVKLLETRTQRDQFIVVGTSLFLLLAACLADQRLARAPLYLLQTWLSCTALALTAGTRRRTDFGSRAALLLAGRSLALALPLAVAMFVFFPRITGAFWSIPRDAGATTGLSDTMNPGDIANLTTSYDVAFRATFTGEPPPPEERYWRGPVLHEFDGHTWRRQPGFFTHQPTLQSEGPAYHYRIDLEPSSQHWWLALDTVDAAPGDKVRLTYDAMLVSVDPVTEPVSYSLSSHTRTRSDGRLSTALRRHDTAAVPGNPRTHALASELRARATDDSTYISSVLDFLRQGGFQYSLTPPRLGADGIDDLLFMTRSGFCGHYASAFVSLMRAAGLPAHVVTGYLGGEWNPIGGYFIVRQSDAHAWAEVWLEGRGWTRIDPTAVVEPERLHRGILDLLPDAVSARARFVWSNPWLAGMLQRWDALNAAWNTRVIHFDYSSQLHLLEKLGLPSAGVQELGWMFCALLIGWLAWVTWRMRTRGRPARPDRLARAYIRLCNKLARIGIQRQPSSGPLAFADEIARRRPELGPAVRELFLQYAQLRFGPPHYERAAEGLVSFERRVARLRLSPS